MKPNVFFLGLFCLTLSMINAQTITFTDANFKNALLDITVASEKSKDLNGNWCAVDSNGDGDIQVSEAENLSYLYVSFKGITNANEISYFTALTYLDCTSNQIPSLDLSNCTDLTELYCTANFLTSLDVSNCADLTMLECDYNNLTSLDVSACTALTFLRCSFNNLTSLNVSSCTDLMYLICDQNNLTSLDVSDCTALTMLNCGWNDLTSLDVSDLTALTDLAFYNNQLTSIDVSSCTDLMFLLCDDNDLTSLDVSNCTDLNYLACNGNNLTQLNITGTQIESFEESEYGNNSFIEICCNANQYQDLFSYLQNNGYPNCIVNVGTNCSPVNQSIVSVTFDNDSDGCDPNDDVLESFKVNVHSSIQDTDFEFNENSNYTIYAAGNVATITPIINNSYFTITPPSYSVNYSQGNFQTLEFCVAPNGNHNDLEITLVPENFAVPGFDAQCKIIYKNNGTTTLSGNVQLTFEDDYMDLVSATPSVDTQSTNSLTWNYSNLAPFESREIQFTMDLNTPTDATYPLNGGDILSFQAQINPITGDELPSDNTALLQQTVVNSLDPNDKILLEGSQILPEMVGEYVHYRIRFENTGTANAINVFVEDTIDPTKFDISTLEVVDASHSVRTVIEDDLVKFQFYNINLPFDDANNDGYVVFKIKTLDTLELNDTFSNQAEIYFDYNAPIVTNNFTTTIVENLGTEDVESPSDLFTLSPNPAKDFFTLQSQEEVAKVELFDASGRLVKTFIGNATQYDVSALSQGMYVVKVYTATQTQNVSFIKK